jgi:periplasmic protein CpxP/Spy
MKTSLPSTHSLRRVMCAAALLSLSFFGVAQAQPMPPHGGPGGGMHHSMMGQVEHMAKFVGASNEQKAKLTAIAQAAQADMKTLHEQAQAGRKQGLALLSASKIDRDAIEQHRQQQAQIMDKISKRMTQAMADSAEVLTPEQRSKLAERMQSHEARHGGMRERMQGERGMPAKPVQ